MARIETNMMMVLCCSTVRWNHYLMCWGGWPLEALDRFRLMCIVRFDIHAWNMARGWMDEERFGSSILHSGGTWNSQLGFRICIVNMRLFLLVYLWVLYWIICGLYGSDLIGISIAITLVTYVFYGSNYVWLPSFLYLYMNEQCIYGLAKMTRKQCLIANLK